MINAIAICPTHDAAGKRDVSRVFRPEAEAFLRLHAGDRGVLVSFDNRAPVAARRAVVESAIWQSYPGDWVDHVAFFCHGLRDSIQTGHRKNALEKLAQSIAWRARPKAPLVVTLYACDTARDHDRDRADDTADPEGGEGGFADALRDALRTAGASTGWLDAHPVTAHATRAPYVRRFRLEGAEPGAWLVRPHGPAWGVWRKALWGKVPGLEDLRLRFPRMSGAEIHAALGGE